MSSLLGTESLAEGKQIIVVHADDYDAAKRQFGSIFPVVGCNGRDTDISPLYGRSVVLIGDAASIHAPMLHSVRGDATIKVVPHELDPWAETHQALEFAKKNAFVFEGEQVTVSAQDSPQDASVIPFSDPLVPDAEAPLPEPPAYILEAPPVEALHYPDSSAFTRDEIPPEIEWIEPRDIFVSDGPPAWVPGLLPSVLSDFVEDAQRRIGASAGYAAVSVLTCLAAACDDFFRLQPKRRDTLWTVRPTLWGIGVGSSGSGKTPMLEAGLLPLGELDKERRVEVAAKAKAFNLKMEIYEQKKKDYVSKMSKGGTELVEIPEEPVPESDKCLVINDSTMQGLAQFLLKHERGCLLWADEFSALIGSFDRFTGASADRGEFLKLFNGGTNVVQRAAKGGSFVIPNWSANVLGGITPSALRKAMGDGLQEDGLLQRCLLFVGGERSAGEDVEPDYAAHEAYTRILRNLLNLDARRGEVIKLSDGAQEAYDEFVGRMLEYMRFSEASSGLISQVSKYEGIAPRIMLTLHCAMAAEKGEYPGNVIDTRIAENVCKMMTEIFLPHAEYFWSNVIGTSARADQAEQKLGLYILAHKSDVLTNRDIEAAIRADWAFPNLSQSARVAARKKILENLNEAGWISSRLDGARKFQGYATVHDVNPAVHTAFARLASDERDRRHAISNLLATKRAEAAARRA